MNKKVIILIFIIFICYGVIAAAVINVINNWIDRFVERVPAFYNVKEIKLDNTDSKYIISNVDGEMIAVITLQEGYF